MNVGAAVANRLYMAAALAERRRFERALHDPAAAQRDILLRIVRANAYSAFGRRHGFAGIRSVADYRERVPLQTYESLEQDILRMADGTRRVLTAAPLVCFEVTGGTARNGANKLIPYTRALLREFASATLPWTYDLLRHRPALRNGRSYWAVTPPVRHAEFTSGGVPIGLEHDADYFPAFARRLLDRVLGSPRVLARAPDVESWRYLTLRALLAMPDLTFISIWNPSFLTLLADALDAHWERLLNDLETGTLSIPLAPELSADATRALPALPALATELRRRFHRRAPENLGALWPQLALISCWTEAHARRALPAMRHRFPRVEVQGKGLLATEGVVSFPLFAHGEGDVSVAAVTSHFLEFVPVGEPAREVGVEALDAGGMYEVLLTTSGGLYRYALRDLVRVEGHVGRTPLLSFQGRADLTSDLVGEKLTPMFAEQVLQLAATETGVRSRFAMLTPVWDPSAPPRYDLLVECDATEADRLAQAVESRLSESHHYALCRRLGQLGEVRAVVVRDGAREYERVCLARGQRLSAIKPAALGTLGGHRR